jgi:hypothetical protein
MKLIFWSMVFSGAFALGGCSGCGGDVVVIEPGTGGAGGQSGSTASTGVSSSGTGGYAECFPCARMLDDAGFESSKLCPDSVPLHAELAACVCGGPCPACDDADFCDGFFMSGLCSPCAEQVCADEMAACLDDYYPPK